MISANRDCLSPRLWARRRPHMSQTLWGHYPEADDMLSSGSGSDHQESKLENQCWDPALLPVAQFHSSLKLIMLMNIITLASDHKTRLTLTDTCLGCGARVHVSVPVCWSITALRINNWVIVRVKWAPVIITLRGINHGSRVTIDTFYRCL